MGPIRQFIFLWFAMLYCFRNIKKDCAKYLPFVKSSVRTSWTCPIWQHCPMWRMVWPRCRQQATSSIRVYWISWVRTMFLIRSYNFANPRQLRKLPYPHNASMLHSQINYLIVISLILCVGLLLSISHKLWVFGWQFSLIFFQNGDCLDQCRLSILSLVPI